MKRKQQKYKQIDSNQNWAKYKQASRSLLLGDIENLVLGVIDGRLAARRFDLLLEAARFKPGDLGYIASNKSLWKCLAWHVCDKSNCQYVVSERGQDSADLALLDRARNLDLSTFDRLVIGSGDGIFAEIAYDAGQAGLSTVVIANSGSLAGHLRYFADEVVELTPPPLRP